MARIRTIKPGFFTSEDVAALSMRARLTWIGLWTHVDDEGRAKDNPRLIHAAVWPLDDVTVKQVEQDLVELAAHGRIVRYEVDGKRYLAVTNWNVHQRINRPARSVFPTPDEASFANGSLPDEASFTDVQTRDESSVTTHGALTEDSVKAHGALTAGRERKGKEYPSSADADGAFAEFWNLYPRKVGKQDARKVWDRKTRDHPPPDILAGLKRWVALWETKGTEHQFIPHPTTWLQRGSWEDQLEDITAGQHMPDYWKQALA